MFFSEGNYWGRMRRLISPSFSHKNVTSMGDTVGEEIDAMITRLKTVTETGPQIVQMNEEAFYFTIRVISAVAFGGLQGEMKEYFFSKQLMVDVNTIFETMFHRLIIPVPYIYWYTGPPYPETLSCFNLYLQLTSSIEPNPLLIASS